MDTEAKGLRTTKNEETSISRKLCTQTFNQLSEYPGVFYPDILSRSLFIWVPFLDLTLLDISDTKMGFKSNWSRWSHQA